MKEMKKALREQGSNTVIYKRILPQERQPSSNPSVRCGIDWLDVLFDEQKYCLQDGLEFLRTRLGWEFIGKKRIMDQDARYFNYAFIAPLIMENADGRPCKLELLIKAPEFLAYGPGDEDRSGASILSRIAESNKIICWKIVISGTPMGTLSFIDMEDLILWVDLHFKSSSRIDTFIDDLKKRYSIHELGDIVTKSYQERYYGKEMTSMWTSLDSTKRIYETDNSKSNYPYKPQTYERSPDPYMGTVYVGTRGFNLLRMYGKLDCIRFELESVDDQATNRIRALAVSIRKRRNDFDPVSESSAGENFYSMSSGFLLRSFKLLTKASKGKRTNRRPLQAKFRKIVKDGVVGMRGKVNIEPLEEKINRQITYKISKAAWRRIEDLIVEVHHGDINAFKELSQITHLMSKSQIEIYRYFRMMFVGVTDMLMSSVILEKLPEDGLTLSKLN